MHVLTIKQIVCVRVFINIKPCMQVYTYFERKKEKKDTFNLGYISLVSFGWIAWIIYTSKGARYCKQTSCG